MSQQPTIYYAVLRERGENWDTGRPMRQQKQWDEHAAFMDMLVEDGFVILGGPLGEGEEKFMHIIAAEGAQAIEDRFADDPWNTLRLLRTVSVVHWTILLDARR